MNDETVWRRNPGYKPEWLSDDTRVDVRFLDDHISYNVKAKDVPWFMGGVHQGIWEYRIVEEARKNTKVGIKEYLDINDVLDILYDLLKDSKVSFTMSGGEFLFDINNQYYEASNAEDATSVLTMLLNLEKYHVN